jgi:hypothetical protein
VRTTACVHLPLAPNNVIAFLLAQHLGIVRPSLEFSTSPGKGDISADFFSLLLMVCLSFWLKASSKKFLTGSPMSGILRGNLDPNQLENNHIVLTWQRKAPVFMTDFDIYIREQYKALPKFQRAVITLFPQTGMREMTLLILFQHWHSLERFSNFRNSIRLQDPAPETASQIRSATSEVVLSIRITFKVMISETTTFLQGCSVELEKMVRFTQCL